jgi:DNA-binding transcriptional LysR family regulator
MQKLHEPEGAVRFCRNPLSPRQVIIRVMETSVLNIFVEVMRRGSFAAVARDRATDPSSVSRAIASLEEELGVRLFQRNTRRLSPTEAAVLYFERLEPLLAELDDARESAINTRNQVTGTLRVTAAVSIGQKCVVPLLPGFMRTYPNLTVDLALTDSMLDLVGERIDVAIRLGNLVDSSLVAHRLMSVTYVVCASPEYLKQVGAISNPLAVRERECLLFPLPVFRSRWIFRDKNDKKRDLTEVPVKGRLYASSGIALHECALAGMGLALLPRWLVGCDIRDGKLIDVFPGYDVTPTDFNTAAWFVYPSKNRVPKKVRVFVDYLKKEFRDQFP